MPRWNFRDVMSTTDFRQYVQRRVEEGVQIVGGCCGLSSDHIRAIADLRRWVELHFFAHARGVMHRIATGQGDGLKVFMPQRLDAEQEARAT